MEVKTLRIATDIFKSISSINPTCMKDIFQPKLNSKVRPTSWWNTLKQLSMGIKA